MPMPTILSRLFSALKSDAKQEVVVTTTAPLNVVPRTQYEQVQADFEQAQSEAQAAQSAAFEEWFASERGYAHDFFSGGGGGGFMSMFGG